MNERPSNPLLEVLAGVASALVVPILIAWWAASSLSGRQRVWRLRGQSRMLWIFAIVGSAVATVLVARHLYSELSHAQWKTALWTLMLLWLCEVPIGLAVGVLRLQHIATRLHHGRLAPNRAEPTRRAIIDAGVADARERFRRAGCVLPDLIDGTGIVVGVVAQAPDHRMPITRFMEPERDVLHEMNQDGLLVMPLSASSPSHHLVIGATGSGKSTLLSRMALASLRRGFRVAIIDMKGGTDEAELFLGLGQYMTQQLTTKRWPGEPLDLWRGTAADVADRVVGFLPPPAPGGGEYYRARLVRAIKAVTERTTAGVPRNPTELLNRIRNIGAFANDPEDREALMRKSGGVTVAQEIAEALGSYLEPLRMAGDRATAGGWTWSDPWDLAVISLDATREQMKRLGAAILHDFDAWTRSADREVDPRPMMLIVDEGGVLQSIHGAPALTNLVARARSARVSVVIAAQTLSSLGPDGEQIMATGTTRWLGRSPDPEQMSMASGTRSAVETGHQDGMNGLTGGRSLREQRALLVDPDLVRRLPNFVWVVSEHGKAILGYCPPLNYHM